jgi:hypothetical protein
MPVNPKSLLNLKSVKPGDPPLNPTGKNGSEDGYLTSIIRKTAREIPPGETLTRGELFIQSLWDDALSKRPSEIARRILSERCDGRLPLALMGEGGGPIMVRESPFKAMTDEELDEQIRQLKEIREKPANGRKRNGKANGKRNGSS